MREQEEIISKTRDLILSLIDDNLYSWYWKAHVERTVYYSRLLAQKLGGDVFVCELSAWLHDIVKIKDGNSSFHHIKGSEEASVILAKFGVSEEVVNLVKGCVLTHSSDEKYVPHSLNEKIISCSDALSMFDMFLLMVKYSFVVKKESVEEAKISLLKKYSKAWNKLLLPEARELAHDKYKAIKLLLGSQEFS